MGLGKKVLSIDIDGVLATDTCERVLDYINKKYDVDYNIKDIYQFNQTLNTFNGDIKLGPIFREFTKDRNFVMSLAPDEDAIDFIRFLTDCYIINISSSRPVESYPFTVEWLQQNKIYFDNLELPSSKTVGDVLIDDYDENILKFLSNGSDKLGVLFMQPWSINNKNTHNLHCLDKRFKMCSNWHEVYDEVNGFYNLIC